MLKKEQIVAGSSSRNSSATSVRSETRTTSYTYSERHSTVSTNSTSGGVSHTWNSTPRASPSTSARPRTIFDLPGGLERDARVWNPGQGYTSPFSRQLPAYRSAGSVPSTSTPSGSSYSNHRSVSVSSPPPGTSSLSQVPSYDVDGKRQVLIINNVNFSKKSDERKGAKKDEEDLIKIFRDLGFSIIGYRDQKRSEMRSKIKNFSSKSDLNTTKLIVVVIMSHGHNRDNNDRITSGGYTQILGTDGKGLEVDEVLEMFTSVNCPKMSGKPKIFIFQNCRGEAQEVHVDSAPIAPRKKDHADMLIAFSTLPGFFSLRNPLEGSWYIQSLCDVLARHGKVWDIESVLKIVDQQLSTKHPKYSQTSTYESRGFNKNCYLFPR